MKRLRRPRLLARLLGGVLLVVAAWVLVAPVTAIYLTTDANPAPRLLKTEYSWLTSEQDVFYSDATGTDLVHFNGNYDVMSRLANGIRLNCGNIFGPGSHEQVEAPDGPRVCADVRKPRRTVGFSLLGVAVVGFLASMVLPKQGRRPVNTYRQPYSQRRILKRSR